MTIYSKYNVIYRLQKWMDSVPGQTFLNYAYSWGAAIVILGTLFKLTHLKGADFSLFLGMGTEVVVFFLSAFDRPFDKTTDGMNLDTHVRVDGEMDGRGSYEAPVVQSAAAAPAPAAAPVVSMPTVPPEFDAATANYVEELERLNRTITSISKMYEMQLKSASMQIGTIDDINEQTKKMAAQIAELNKIYSRMIEAMTAKMNA
jgi:hypothetical protein